MIFDLDGVLLDSEPLHQRALTSVLAARGHLLTDEGYADLVGLGQSETWRRLSLRFRLNGDLADYREAYHTAVLCLLRQPLGPEPGAAELVEGLRRSGWKLALASSSPSHWVEASLAGLGLDRAFEVVVSGDQVSRGKPDPEIFLSAAARLGVEPARTVAVEDSVHGVEAARQAGMTVLAVRTRYTAGKRLPAHLVVDSLVQLVGGGEEVEKGG